VKAEENEAINFYNNSISKNTTNAISYYNLANTLVHLNLFEKSILNFKIAADINFNIDFLYSDFIFTLLKSAYWEDLDLSWRLQLQGFEGRYVASAVILHTRVAEVSPGGYRNFFTFRHILKGIVSISSF
jgi:tetratricopeptide (TPR) repeat protein